MYTLRDPKIYLICGKARSGKNTVADIIYNCKPNSVQLSMTKYLKDYVKLITDWDGQDGTKPRSLLQSIGIDLVKKEIDSKLLINRTIEDIKVLSYFKDNIIISGIRLKEEIEDIKKCFKKVIVIKVITDKKNSLNEEQNRHITEIDLDDYPDFDYVIDNRDLKTLKAQVESMVENE